MSFLDVPSRVRRLISPPSPRSPVPAVVRRKRSASSKGPNKRRRVRGRRVCGRHRSVGRPRSSFSLPFPMSPWRRPPAVPAALTKAQEEARRQPVGRAAFSVTPDLLLLVVRRRGPPVVSQLVVFPPPHSLDRQGNIMCCLPCLPLPLSPSPSHTHTHTRPHFVLGVDGHHCNPHERHHRLHYTAWRGSRRSTKLLCGASRRRTHTHTHR